MAVDWYIDAWAVRDGAAFASRREPNSRVADNTVFIAMPDLEPVPVGRLTTALSATRRNFQAGLWSNAEVEIAFENLEQIIELVRRGFLAGGLGPGGAGAPVLGTRPELPGGRVEGRAPGDEGGPSEGGATHYEQAVADTKTSEMRWLEDDEPVDHALHRLAAESAHTSENLAVARTIPLLLTLVHRYAEAITIDWEARVQQSPGPSDTKMLVEWHRTLCEVGVWPNIGEMRDFITTHQCAVGERLVLHWWDGPWLAPRGSEAATVPRQHLLSHAPCPLREGWASNISRLADKATLPMCVSNYFEGNYFLPELAPSTLSGLLFTSGSFPSSLVTGFRFQYARLAAALHWIAREIPRINLPLEADELLNRYAWDQCLPEHHEIV